ncbi:MAG TPA: hypothetical protein VH253_16615 [Phycisphaerae bacterium]|nr:hypothetical protein [Phycisphaerae bacterium]
MTEDRLPWRASLTLLLAASATILAAGPASRRAAATAPATAAAAATAAATRPAPDRSTPTAALAAYFDAQRRLNADDLQSLITVTDPDKLQYVQIVLNWMLWTHAFERAAIAKFGPAGLKVLGYLRSQDDQLALDARRLAHADTEFSDDRSQATVFLPVEPDRPTGLQADRFFFLDTYTLRHTADGWRVDFLKTYDCADPAKESLYRFEAGAFPRLATAMKDLTDQLSATPQKFTSAAMLQAAWDQHLNAIYTQVPDK